MDPSKLAALQKKSAETVQAHWDRSLIIDREKETKLPRFTRDDLTKGKFLGEGGFCKVEDIRGFKVDGAKSKKSNEEVPFEDQKFIAEHWKRPNGDARYAIKYLRPDVINDPHRFLQGIVDFATETHFLTCLDHPSIVKLRAVAEGTPFDKKYFLVLDRLWDILDVKIPKWGKQNKRFNKVTDRGGKKTKALLKERLVAARDLSDAVEYMHRNNIIYRDIKPENIGFNVHGTITLFDFGLTKELHNSDKLANGNWKLSAKTGSIRYMAPETYKGLPYNYSSDSFAFAVLLWEMMAMNKPYAGYSLQRHEERVILGGHRLKADESWPQAIRDLILRGWSENASERPSMKSIKETLGKEVAALET